MKFGSLQYLWMLWLLPAVVLFFIWSFRRKRQLIDRFVSPELKDRLLKGFSPKRQRLKASLLVLSLVFAVIALIRPKYGFHWQEVKRKGVDIVIALDVSKSMLAEDVSPNRMERAKREILDLVNLVEGDRVGLVAFAGTSFLQCPLTLDYGAVQIFLDELDTDIIPVPGTAIAESIEKSVAAFDQKDRSARVIILITDGEDHQRDPEEAAKVASENNVKIYAVGIGQEGGAPIPDGESGGFKKNSRGEVVMTKLDEPTLQKIALATGGSYVRSVTGNLDLEKIYEDIRSSVEDKELQSGRRKRYEERFQWPLLIALLLLVWEAVIRESVRTSSPRVEKGSENRRLAPVGLLVAGLIAGDILGGESEAWALPFTESQSAQGESQYDQGQYEDALKNLLDAQVENPGDVRLKYNLGNAYYKVQDYENAAKMFGEVLAKGGPELQQQAQYNMGNVAYQQGKLQEAAAAYTQALEMNPEDEDAKHNLEFVRNEIRRRLEEQKQRQQQQGDQQQQQGDQQQQQGDQQQQQGDQQQQQGDQQQQQGEESAQQPSPQNDDPKAGEGEKPADQANQEEGEQTAAEQRETASKETGSKETGSKEKDSKETMSEQAMPEGTMSEEEAMRWLSTLSSDRKDLLKRKFGKRRYKVEKDW